DGWRIVIHGAAGEGAQAQGQRRYATAEAHRVTPAKFDETLAADELAGGAMHATDLEAIYATCRAGHLSHEYFMRAARTVTVSAAQLHVDCRLSDVAAASAAQLMFHPVLIDASAIGGGVAAAHWMQGAPPAQLALPLFFESFRASDLLQQQCTTRIRRAL